KTLNIKRIDYETIFPIYKNWLSFMLLLVYEDSVGCATPYNTLLGKSVSNGLDAVFSNTRRSYFYKGIN
ncbi:hypothetical protein, partial [Bartonella vinsonii]|uniref:hypothetical protein n=1 Tax=Bartonella vinsonii TaxID=33047 RepID=UPI001AEBE87E